LASGAANAIGKSNREAMAVGVELHDYRSAGAKQSSAAPSETAAAVANRASGRRAGDDSSWANPEVAPDADIAGDIGSCIRTG
jgi:hypothetical protein